MSASVLTLSGNSERWENIPLDETLPHTVVNVYEDDHSIDGIMGRFTSRRDEVDQAIKELSEKKIIRCCFPKGESSGGKYVTLAFCAFVTCVAAGAAGTVAISSDDENEGAAVVPFFAGAVLGILCLVAIGMRGNPISCGPEDRMWKATAKQKLLEHWAPALEKLRELSDTWQDFESDPSEEEVATVLTSLEAFHSACESVARTNRSELGRSESTSQDPLISSINIYLAKWRVGLLRLVFMQHMVNLLKRDGSNGSLLIGQWEQLMSSPMRSGEWSKANIPFWDQWETANPAKSDYADFSEYQGSLGQDPISGSFATELGTLIDEQYIEIEKGAAKRLYAHA